MKNINLGAHFLFLVILCSIKIERLLLLKILKNLAFFDSYFWPFNKSEEIFIFVIFAIILSIWKAFIKFRWHDEKLNCVECSLDCRNSEYHNSFCSTQQSAHVAITTERVILIISHNSHQVATQDIFLCLFMPWIKTSQLWLH